MTTGSSTAPPDPANPPPQAGIVVLLHQTAIPAAVACGVTSLYQMMRAGTRDGATIPPLLLILFTGWVLAPFVAMVVAILVSGRWPAVTRTTLHAMTILVSFTSLAIYTAETIGAPRPKPAAPFLLVPLGAWVLMAVAIALAAGVATLRSRPGSSA